MKDVPFIYRQETQPLAKPKNISKDIEKFLANKGKIQNIPQGESGMLLKKFNNKRGE